MGEGVRDGSEPSLKIAFYLILTLMYWYIHVYTSIHTYIQIYIYVLVYICIHIDIYTELNQYVKKWN